LNHSQTLKREKRHFLPEFTFCLSQACLGKPSISQKETALIRKQLSSGERGVSLTNIPAEEELLAVDLKSTQDSKTDWPCRVSLTWSNQQTADSSWTAGST
jgi:hypothetical protein